MAGKVLTSFESLEEIIKGRNLLIMFIVCKMVAVWIKIYT